MSDKPTEKPTIKGLPVAGYVDQSSFNVDLVNVSKELEEELLQRLDTMAGEPEIDKRWLAIARTGFEQAFMAMNRAVFKPQRLKGKL